MCSFRPISFSLRLLPCSLISSMKISTRLSCALNAFSTSHTVLKSALSDKISSGLASLVNHHRNYDVAILFIGSFANDSPDRLHDFNL